MKRLNIAMLSQQAQAQVEPVETQSELDVVGQQVEDSIAEATQIQAEIEGTQQAMDDAEQVIQEVDEERQVLEQAQQQGGAEQPAMEALQRAVARFEKRTGVACSIRSMGMESFSSKSTRVKGTEVAMEGAVDYIKKLIKMLLDAMAAVWEKVKSFIDKILVGADRLSKRAKKLAASAKGLSGKTAAADAKVDTGSVISFAHIDGSTLEGSEFAKAYIATLEKHDGATDLSIKKAGSGLESGRLAKLVDIAKVKGSEKEIIAAAYEEAKQLNALGEAGEVKDGYVTAEKDGLMGGYSYVVKVYGRSISWEQLSKGYSGIYSKIVATENAKENKAKELKVLSVEDCTKVAEAADKYMQMYVNLRDVIKLMDPETKKIAAEAKKLEKEKDAPVEQIKVATGIIRAVVNAHSEAMVSARGYDIRLTKAALDYVAASLSAADGRSIKDKASDAVSGATSAVKEKFTKK